MKQPSIKMSMAGVALSVLCSAALAQAPAQAQRVKDFGKSLYEANCASCHGMNGKGGGPFVELLRRAPPDLTLEAKNNQGVFPMDRLYAVIEGANVPSHGSRDMPIWGREFRIKDAEYYIDTPYDADALVRARILSLLEYLNRIQVR